jgi:hypothetical protein
MSRLLSHFGISIQVGVIGAIALLGFVLIGIIYFVGSAQQISSQAELDLATKSRAATSQRLTRNGSATYPGNS